MWVRVEDTAPLHPKMYRVGVAAYGWWQAALCYCARYLTDGFLPTSDLDLIFPGTTHEAVLQHVEHLIREGLLELQTDGYALHDYLDYQPSREQAIRVRRDKVEAGRKGGQTTGKLIKQAASAHAEAHAKGSAEPPSRPVPSRSEVVSGCSNPLPATNTSLEMKQARKARVVLTDDQFMASLRTNEAYKHLDLDEQLGRMDAWLSTRPGRQKTRRFIVGWLNRQDRPVNDNGNYARAMKTRTDMSGLRAFAEKRRAP